MNSFFFFFKGNPVSGLTRLNFADTGNAFFMRAHSLSKSLLSLPLPC